MYFANYIKLTGIVRELFVRDCVELFAESFHNGLVLITRNACCDYIKPFHLFDIIDIQLYFTSVRKASVDLMFHFYKQDTQEIHAKSTQTIVFADGNGLTRIPENFRTAIEKYLIT